MWSLTPLHHWTRLPGWNYLNHQLKVTELTIALVWHLSFELWISPFHKRVKIYCYINWYFWWIQALNIPGEFAVPWSNPRTFERETDGQRVRDEDGGSRKTVFWHLQLVCGVLQVREAVYNSPSCLSLTSPCLPSVMLSAAEPLEPLHLLEPPAKKHTLGSRQEERHLKQWAEQRSEFTQFGVMCLSVCT